MEMSDHMEQIHATTQDLEKKQHSGVTAMKHQEVYVGSCPQPVHGFQPEDYL